MSTVSSSSALPNKAKANTSGKNYDKIQRYRDITESLMKQHFKAFYNVPDSLYVVMATIGYESGWELWHKSTSRGKPENEILAGYSSVHKSPVAISTGGTIGQYWYSPSIQNLIKSKSHDLTIMRNIHEGRVAHGLSASMGWNHVRNTRTYEMFAQYQNLVDQYGLAVNPGESISALFPNNETGAIRSIMSCLINLNHKFKIAKKKFPSESDALKEAVGNYVGGKGKLDPNKYGHMTRVNDIYYRSSGVRQDLASIGVALNGYTVKVPASSSDERGTLSVSDSISSSPKTVSNTPSITQNTQTASSTGTPAKAQHPPGCA